MIMLLVLICCVAPVDIAQYARSVREDTAELASYALSDKASTQSSSPPVRRSVQTQLESYFNQGSESESASHRDIEGVQHDIIQEVSEPDSPESGPSNKAPGTSALANMLKKSPLSGSPQDNDGAHDDKSLRGRDEDQADSAQGRLIITSNGVRLDASERTPLLGKDTNFETHHPDWIRGQQDIERQELKRRKSWPKLRNIILWPKEKSYDIASVVFNPKRWDRKAILEHTVKAPLGYMPAVVLGVLLNILDALSYGMSCTFNIKSGREGPYFPENPKYLQTSYLFLFVLW